MDTYGMFQLATVGKVERVHSKLDRPKEAKLCLQCGETNDERLLLCHRCYGKALCDLLMNLDFCAMMPSNVLFTMRLEMFEAGIRCGVIVQIGDKS